MKLTLTRLDVTDHGIFGHLEIEGSPFNCVTLERHDIAIPVGTYPIELYDSPEHGIVPLLRDVPNRTFIELHEGNWEFNSKGCILVGEKRNDFDKTMILNSKPTLHLLVSLLKDQPTHSITII